MCEATQESSPDCGCLKQKSSFLLYRPSTTDISCYSWPFLFLYIFLKDQDQISVPSG